MKKKKNSLWLLIFVLAILVTVAVVLLLGGSSDPEAEAAVATGISYLESLEAKDPASVDAALREIRQRKLEAEREEMLNKINSGEINVWSMFDDYVVLGDSRAVGFYYFDFLEKDRVLADAGETIANVKDRMEQIRALNPSYIYLCYGINDVSIGYWDTAEEYASAMAEVITSLQQEFPNAMIVVSSILPARDPAFARSSAWYNIPAYSAAVESWCKENGVPFANNDKISEEHADLWQPDGIHLQPEFYPYWAGNLIGETLEGMADENNDS